MIRRPFIVGNWKMHKTISTAQTLTNELITAVGSFESVDVGVAPPFLALDAVVDACTGSGIEVFAQTMHEADEGAFTGEVSAPMLVELGIDGVILGHSERRQFFGETDRALTLKVPKALAAGLTPILCVGESEDEREKGETERKLRHQVQEGLGDVAVDRIADVVIAYEPIWAIGTGAVATPDQAQDACSFIRALVGNFDRDASKRVRVLYGGSVKADNTAELMALPDVDGALVGGASLDAADFAQIVQQAASVAAAV